MQQLLDAWRAQCGTIVARLDKDVLLDRVSRSLTEVTLQRDSALRQRAAEQDRAKNKIEAIMGVLRRVGYVDAANFLHANGYDQG